MIKNILILLFFVLSLVFFYKNRELNTTLIEQSKIHSDLEDELKRVRTELVRDNDILIGKPKSIDSTKATSAQQPEVLPAIKKVETIKPNEDYKNLERLSELSSVEKLVALSDEERKSINQLITEDKLDDPQSLKNILGEQKFTEYEKAKELFSKQIRDEQVENELFSLSRKLNLDKQQEDKVKEIIVTGKELYFPLNEKVDKKLSLKEKSIQRVMREMQRQAYNAEGLKEILNETQYNNYLEMQATSAANQSHDSFLSTATKE